MLEHLNSSPILPERVVIVGATGFVGGQIVQNLKNKSIDVLGFSSKELDLTNKESVTQLSKILKPTDRFIFVSAIAPCRNNSELIKNIIMAENICQALEQKPVEQVVYISSDAVYSDSEHRICENSPTSPSSLHGVMHLAREVMLRTSLGETPLAILRPSLLYGAKDPHNGYGPNRFFRQALKNEDITLFGNGEEKRDHVRIEDVAEIVCQVLLHHSKGVLNIATAHSSSFREVAEKIIKTAGSSSKIKPTVRQNPITHRYFDTTNLLKAFPNFHFLDFFKGIENLIQEAKQAA